jgi:hypothetical protein
MEIGALQVLDAVGQEDVRGLEILRGNLPGPVVAIAQFGDPGAVDIETDGAAYFAEGDRDRKPHVTEPDNGYDAV